MKEKKIVINGKTIFYRTIGQGHVVILIHGFGEDGWIWKNQFDAFDGFQLIIPDLPGSGKSELIDDMSIEGMADCIKEMIAHPGLPGEKEISSQPLLDQEANKSLSHSTSEVSALLSPFGRVGGGSKVGAPGLLSLEKQKGAVVIGHSMGGYVTLALAEKYPELLNGLGLFHSTAYKDSEEKKATRRKGIEFIQAHGAFEFLKTTIPNLYSDITKIEKKEIVENQIALSNNFSADALVRYYEAMMKRPDRTKVLKNIKVPVLFVLGKYDNAVPMKDGLEQCSLPDLAYIHILESSGHMGMREEPEGSNQILKNYLKNICHHAQ